MTTKPTALKVMSLLLYGFYDYLEVSPDGLAHLRLGPFARHLRVKHTRLKEYLQWLEKCNYIADLTSYHGYVTFRVVEPPLIKSARERGGLEDKNASNF